MATIQEYKCPCCGGAIEFNTQVQKMKCPYCDTEFEMDALRELDEVLGGDGDNVEEMKWDTHPGQEWQEGDTEGLRIYVCKSCGGEIVGDETLAATKCPYCDNPVVLMGQFAGDLKPDYVIPFKLTKEDAKEGLRKHVKGKILLPKMFKDENHIDEIKGVYVPFWLFEADADAKIRYKATKVRTWSDSDYNYTETRHFAAVRAGSVGFERIPVDGSSKIADDLMESIEPFNFGEAVDFQTAYLSGYLADRYDVTAEQSIDRANERVRFSTEQAFRDTVQGYTSVTPESTNIILKNGEAKYALYPVYLLNTTYKGEKYTFAMNGQTGKFVGNLPMDKGAFWKWFGIIALAGSALGYGILQLISCL